MPRQVAGAEKEVTTDAQPAYAMANLRPATTGLPFVVFIVQGVLPRRDAQIKVSASPYITCDRMASYAVTPFGFAAGARLLPYEEDFLRLWVEKNEQALLDYWDGTIAYTENAIESLVRSDAFIPHKGD